MAAMQEIVHAFLGGVTPEAFPEHVRFFCTADVPAPKGFGAQWAALSSEAAEAQSQEWLSEATLERTSVIIVMADTSDAEQMAALSVLGLQLREQPLIAPPVFLLPIMSVWGENSREPVEALLASGVIDDVVWGAPRGYSFAFAVQAKLKHISNQLRELSRKYEARTQTADKLKGLRSDIDYTNWHYLRAKVFRSIPPVQNNVREDSRSVAGITMRAKLSRGLFGSVYLATRMADQRANSQACSMLVVEKGQRSRSMAEMQMLSHYLSVMETLDRFIHPNISHLITIIHTPKRLCVCTEICGRKTLYSRLTAHDGDAKRELAPQPLSAASVRSLARKVSAAVGHLHEVVGLCHRDIKPENFTVRELEDGEYDVKLSGFELAMVQEEGCRCRTACGTMPFAAPEAIMPASGGYDGRTADLWSVGVLFLELACGVRCIEKRIGRETLVAPEPVEFGGALSAAAPPLRPCQGATRDIQSLFSQPDAIESFLDKSSIAETKEVQSWLAPMIKGLLRVDPAERLTTAHLLKMMQTS